MNRILSWIERAKTAIQAKALPPEKLAELHKGLDMPVDEYCHFQTLKSAAVGTKLTLDEAQTIYDLLGNTPEHFNRQPLEIKYALTKVFSELIKTEIRQMAARL